MSIFNTVTSDELDNIQVNAGMLLKVFDPMTPAAPTSANIIGATTGGITATCVPTFEDFGADIDNCPNNTKEMKRITGWDCTLATTMLDMNEDIFKLAIGAATKYTETTSRPASVEPRAQVAQQDFADLWFVSERVDDKIIAIQLKNALSTGGFSYKTQKNGKGQLAVTFTGHVAISNTADIPMKFYLCDEDGYTPATQTSTP